PGALPPNAAKNCSNGVPLNGFSSGRSGSFVMSPTYPCRQPSFSLSWSLALVRGAPARLGRVPDPTAPSVVRLCDIRDTPLDVAEVLAALGDPAAGGLVVFVGVVRDHDD